MWYHVTDAVAAEEDHHESDIDEDAAMSNDVTAAPASAPVAAARAPAFHDDDTSSEVNGLLLLVWQILCVTAFVACCWLLTNPVWALGNPALSLHFPISPPSALFFVVFYFTFSISYMLYAVLGKDACLFLLYLI